MRLRDTVHTLAVWVILHLFADECDVCIGLNEDECAARTALTDPVVLNGCEEEEEKWIRCSPTQLSEALIGVVGSKIDERVLPLVSKPLDFIVVCQFLHG